MFVKCFIGQPRTGKTTIAIRLVMKAKVAAKREGINLPIVAYDRSGKLGQNSSKVYSVADYFVRNMEELKEIV